MTDAEVGWRALLGRKISIRYRLHGDPAHPFSEAIGVVMFVVGSDDEERVRIMTRRGEEVEVATSDILASKTFPL